MDQAGNLYVVGSTEVRVINLSTGIVSRAVGTGYWGNFGDGGAATMAEVSNPTGLAFDAAGNLYFTDIGNNNVRKVTFAPPVTAAPSISLPAGSYTSLQYATLTDTTPHATIYYTLDGSTPTTSSHAYSVPIYIGGTVTLKAIAVAPELGPSDVTTASYRVTLPAAAKPEISPAAGKYIGSVTVSLSDTTPAAAIHYTVDGSALTSSSPVYAGPFVLTNAATIKAIATAPGYWKSLAVGAQFSVVPMASKPVISPATPNVAVGQLVTITDADAGATIRYTTDGTTPTTHSQLYSGPFPIRGSATVKAIAIATGKAMSLVAAQTYVAAQ